MMKFADLLPKINNSKSNNQESFIPRTRGIEFKSPREIKLMKNLINSRQFHKALAPWVFLPLFISSITGLLYRVSKDLLGYSREQVHWLMSLHEGEWLGENGELIYVILNSLGVLWMLITGFQMFSKTISFTKKVTKGESKG